MRMNFWFVEGAEVEDLPVSFNWHGEGMPERPTLEEVQMILLFEIADALKALAYPPSPSNQPLAKT